MGAEGSWAKNTKSCFMLRHKVAFIILFTLQLTVLNNHCCALGTTFIILKTWYILQVIDYISVFTPNYFKWRTIRIIYQHLLILIIFFTIILKLYYVPLLKVLLILAQIIFVKLTPSPSKINELTKILCRKLEHCYFR